MKQMQYYFLLGLMLLNSILVFSQAKRETTGGEKSVLQTTVTKQGKAIGETITKMIGSEGGTIISEDGLLTVTIPEGSLSADTEIGIQMIENTNPAVFGFSYRITPHHITFSKPAVLGFKYEDEMLDKIDPSILLISTFENGKWMGMAGKVSQEQGTISFETSHFSDWNMINSIKITPTSQYLAEKESSRLRIVEFGLDPQKLKEGQSMQVQQPKEIDSRLVKTWEIHGRGELLHLGSSANYTAPSGNSELGKDEIVATVNYQKGTLLLYAWVRLLRPGVYFEVEGKKYDFPEVTQWYNGNISAQTDQGSLSIRILGETVNSTGQWRWKNQADLPTTFEFDTPIDKNGDTKSYKAYYYPGKNADQQDSNGRIQISYFGSDDDYVSGSFTITNAGIFQPDDDYSMTDTTPIKGYFRIYRWKEKKF